MMVDGGGGMLWTGGFLSVIFQVSLQHSFILSSCVWRGCSTDFNKKKSKLHFMQFINSVFLNPNYFPYSPLFIITKALLSSYLNMNTCLIWNSQFTYMTSKSLIDQENGIAQQTEAINIKKIPIIHPKKTQKLICISCNFHNFTDNKPKKKGQNSN